MDSDVQRGEKPPAQQKGPGKPMNLCSYRNAWPRKPSARQGMTRLRSSGSPAVRETRTRDCERFVRVSERNVHEHLGIHNQAGAKRGSARGKPLEKPRT